MPAPDASHYDALGLQALAMGKFEDRGTECTVDEKSPHALFERTLGPLERLMQSPRVKTLVPHYFDEDLPFPLINNTTFHRSSTASPIDDTSSGSFNVFDLPSKNSSDGTPAHAREAPLVIPEWTRKLQRMERSRLRTPKVAKIQLPSPRSSQHSQLDSEGKAVPNSIVWMRGATSYPSPLLCGEAPKSTLPLRFHQVEFDAEKGDLWARRECSFGVSLVFFFMTLVLFPPALFLLGCGYYDSICGVVSRPVKITSLCGGILVILACVFGIVGAFA